MPVQHQPRVGTQEPVPVLLLLWKGRSVQFDLGFVQVCFGPDVASVVTPTLEGFPPGPLCVAETALEAVSVDARTVMPEAPAIPLQLLPALHGFRQVPPMSLMRLLAGLHGDVLLKCLMSMERLFTDQAPD